MTVLLKTRPRHMAPVVPKHSAQSSRLKALMDEARDIREHEERGEISAFEATERLENLKARHRTVFQRMLGI